MSCPATMARGTKEVSLLEQGEAKRYKSDRKREEMVSEGLTELYFGHVRSISGTERNITDRTRRRIYIIENKVVFLVTTLK